MQLDKSTILIQAEHSHETVNSIATWTEPVEFGELVYRLADLDLSDHGHYYLG